MINEKGRIVWIDQLRGISFFFVILGHVALPKELQSLIYSFHMPLFFMISGLTVNREKIINTPIKDYIVKQTRGLLIPYFWMNFLCFPLWYLAFHVMSQSTDLTIREALLGIFVGNNQIVGAPSNALWFLLALFLGNILYACLLKLTKGNEIPLLCLVSICAIASYLDKGVAQLWHFNVSLTVVMFLYIGNCFMRWYKTSSLNNHKTTANYVFKIIGAVVALTLVGFVSHYLNGRISMTANKFGNSFLLYYITALAFSAAITLVVIHLPKMKPILYIGKNTLLYVGIHIPILRIFEKAFPDILSHYRYSMLFAVVLYFGLVPIVMLFKKFFPFVCGKTTEDRKHYHTVCRVILVAWSLSTIYYDAVACFGLMSFEPLYLILCTIPLVAISIAFVLITQKYTPIIYLEKRRA